MADFIKIQHEGLGLELFPSARVPLLYKKKFSKNLLQDAQEVLMDGEKSVFLIYQSYLARCKFLSEDPQVKEDDIYDKFPATVIVRSAIEIIQKFTKEVEELTKSDNSDTEQKKMKVES